MKDEYKEYYLFLEEGRHAGLVPCMTESAPVLVNKFNIDISLAKEVVKSWVENYPEIVRKYYMHHDEAVTE